MRFAKSLFTLQPCKTRNPSLSLTHMPHTQNSQSISLLPKKKRKLIMNLINFDCNTRIEIEIRNSLS